MVTTASPAVADRIGLSASYFIKRQLVFLVISLFILVLFSFIPTKYIQYISAVGMIFSILLMILVLVHGSETKGAKRWISLMGLSIQPSEFAKPFFVVLTGLILSKSKKIFNLKPNIVSFLLYTIVVALLFLQPDFGMIMTFSAVWSALLFLSGIPFLWIAYLLIFGIVGIMGAYFLLPHVEQRINNFLDPSISENYQITKSIAAFMNGGLTGRGPGEGVVKQHLPDSHTDFIFAVVGEELGAIACFLIITIYCFIFLRGILSVSGVTDKFSAYTVVGLLLIFAMQSIINIGVTLNLMPTKGMTLPFISYGGSSMISTAISMGIVLALTRKRFGYKLRVSNSG